MKITILEAQTIISKHLGVEVQIEASTDNKIEQSNPYLKTITNLKLAPTAGKRYIAKANDIFQSYIDPDFKKWNLNKPGQAKPETKLGVYELIKNGAYKDIFTSASNDLDKICLTQDQIIEFCEKHKDLLSENYTFFLFKENDEFFVARVNFDDGGLYVRVREFEYDDVWFAEYRHRVVLPQLTL